MMSDWLDKELIEKLREPIVNHPLLCRDEKYKKKHLQLYCAVIDRLGTSVTYLNENSSLPNSEEEFLSFLLHCCIILDAVKLLYQKFDDDYPYKVESAKNKSVKVKPVDEPLPENYYHFFKKIVQDKPRKLGNDKIPTDDSFFRYFRALAFAHPFGTTQVNFMQNEDVHYSPYVLTGDYAKELSGVYDDIVGVMIYSTHSSDLMPLIMPFITLKKYINSRYELLVGFIKKIEELIQKQEKEWANQKIERADNPLELIENIYNHLKMIFRDEHDNILKAKDFLEQHSSLDENEEVVEKYKTALIHTLPILCDALENIDLEKYITLLNIYTLPNHPKLGQVLNTSKPIGIIKCWAKELYETFAHKWITIDFENMSVDEIRFLIVVACCLENEEKAKYTE